MSTIRVDNFGPSAGGTTYSARGIAKAWVNFDGTGTIASRDSENVSSLTDNGTGDYSVNFTNAFDAADYAPSTNSGQSASSGAASSTTRISNSATPVTTTSVRIVSLDPPQNNLVDVSIFIMSAHGDLA
jgi:hypothetical protein